MTSLPEFHRQRDMDAIAAFDERDDRRDARKCARLSAEGYNASRCDRCGSVRVLSWVDGSCNEHDPYTEDQMCGGVYRPHRLTLNASNPVTGTVALPVRVGGGL